MSKSPQSRCLVLLVEDMALVAMTLEDELQEAGYAVARPFDTSATALEWLVQETADLAVLDTVLKDGSCKELAAELTRRRVPFVVWSGHQQDKSTLHEFMDAVWVAKPTPHGVLLRALAGLKMNPQKLQQKAM
jgi:DNA-binding response OmpR family regulator